MAVLKYKDPATGEWLPSGGCVVDTDAIVQEVIAAIGTPVFGTVDENNNIILSGELVNGSYTVKYENADGTTTNIGTLSVDGSGGEDSGYTNLADPTSADWLTNQRIKSDKTVWDVGTDKRGDATVIVTNLIAITGVQKLHIKGLDILSNLSSGDNYGRVYLYQGSEIAEVTYQPSAGLTSTGTTHYAVADYDSSVVILDVATLLSDWGKTSTTHVRLGGILTGAAEDVIITADENIV